VTDPNNTEPPQPEDAGMNSTDKNPSETEAHDLPHNHETAAAEPAGQPVRTLAEELAAAGSDTAVVSAEPAAEASTTERTCGACGEQSAIDATFCEACGTNLDEEDKRPKNPCVSCAADATEITEDGWCQMCGTKQPGPDDHVVADHGWFAMVSDRGRVHRTNEDAGAIGARMTGVALVVCDGVSSTDASQDASQNAARTVITHLEQAAPTRVADAIIAGAEAAQTEIVAVTSRSAKEPPSCTLVALVADIEGNSAKLHVGWLGDSRAYWIADGKAEQLTRDHSWALEQLELGELDPEVVKADKRASSITRWLGADSHDVTPELTNFTVELPGVLLVCSDGLWNYARTNAEIHDLVMGGDEGETPYDQAERLVSFANEQGGHDNITVALAHLSSK